MTITSAQLLSLEDDSIVGEVIASIATTAGLECQVAPTAREFLDKLDSIEPDVVTVDLQVPDMDGIEVLRLLGQRAKKSRVILISGMDSRTIGTAAYYAGTLGLTVLGALSKPFEPEVLKAHLAKAVALRKPLTVEDLASAIENRELAVHYQPVARWTDECWIIDSVEALLRWDHPDRGRLLPHEFLSLADDVQMSRDVTDFVLSEGLEQLRGWHAASLHDVALRVNLSARLISDLEFPDRMHTALLSAGLSPELLTMEVNETDTLTDNPDSIEILTRLRLKGIKLAIDDFGIGYSSMTQLFRMPFSEMKVDRSLIEQAAECREGALAVEALIELAHKLEISVCAEGVETQEALEALQSAGCDALQGFVISAAVPARDIPVVVGRWNDMMARRSATGRPVGNLAANQ